MTTNKAVLHPPDDLVAALQDRSCILFAGSGLSFLAGSPTVGTILGRLLEFAVKRKLIDSKLAALLQSGLIEGQYESVAESLLSRTWRDDNPSEELLSLLRDMFSTLERGRLPKAVGKLRRLPFAGVVTTNFDNLLERAFEDRLEDGAYTLKNAEDLKESLARGRFFLLYLRGTLNDPRTLLLSDAQYSERLATNLPLSEFIQNLCLARSHIFIGASEDAIEGYFSSITSRIIGSRQHFALLPVSGRSWALRADVFKQRYNLTVLPYEGEDHKKAILAFTEELSARIDLQSRSTLPGSPRAVSHEAITKIELENFGPFRTLSLELGPHWNVLLGGNGVGKSSLLRAISLVMCGEQARGDIGRLIRAGESHASVAVTIGKERLLVQLRRSDNGEVEVKSFPPRPLETIGKLVIGFPALRSTTRMQVPGPRPPELQRPSYADLLPLLQGDTDHRFEDIKQWLVNLDYRIKHSKTEGIRTPVEQQLQDDFFWVLSRLAQGMKLSFEGIDPTSNDILIRTDDGVVSIDSLSQGTSSLISWVGQVLQRQFDVTDDPKKARNHPSIVLVDEIDAHMHPFWQRIMVEELKQILPSAQFIVTTHSPLVVAGLSKEEIITFVRNQETILVEHPPVDTRGLRADQILTSPLFCLDGTRDPVVDRQISRYTQLSTRPELTADEKSELKKLAMQLHLNLPNPQEKEEARVASEVIATAAQDRLRRMPTEDREKVIREIEIQVQEAITGARRPS